jgi:hypothetical protein
LGAAAAAASVIIFYERDEDEEPAAMATVWSMLLAALAVFFGFLLQARHALTGHT